MRNFLFLQRFWGVLLAFGLSLGLVVGQTTQACANGLVSWGFNGQGQIGDNTLVQRNTPVSVAFPTGVTAFSQIDGGEYTAGALASAGANAGRLYIWGYNGQGEIGDGTAVSTGKSKPTLANLPAAPSTATAYTSFALGSYSTLAKGNDGVLYAWGYNNAGQLGVGDLTRRLVPTAVTLPTGVASFNGPFAIGGNISTAFDHTLAVANDGKLYAWGYNGYGQLGNGKSGNTTNSSIGVVVSLPAGVTPTAVAAGSLHCLALTPNGLYAWGGGAKGALGNGSITTAQSTPVLVSLPTGITATAIDCGEFYSMALGSDGRVYTWGNNAYGQIGDGTKNNRLTPFAVPLPPGVSSFTAISTALRTSYAIANTGQVYAWGDGSIGQIGDGNTAVRLTPTLVSLPSASAPTAIAAGFYNGLAIYNASSGSNTAPFAIADSVISSSLGSVTFNPTSNDYDLEGDTFSLISFSQASHGTVTDAGSGNLTYTTTNGFTGTDTLSYTITDSKGASSTGTVYVSVRSSGALRAFGYNVNGQLGDGTTTNRLIPTVSLLAGATKLAAGRFHSLAVASDGFLYGWGYGKDGQLGNGLVTSSVTPVKVAFPAGVSSWLSVGATSAASNGSSFALGDNGVLYGCGLGQNGQLGNGSTVSKSVLTPVTMPTGVSFTSFSVNPVGSTVLAIGSDNNIYAWGLNTSGQAGIGSLSSPIKTPTTVALPNGAIPAAVSAGSLHGTALDTAGRIYVWGNNTYGQYGKGNTTGASTSPVLMPMPTGVTAFDAISSGAFHTVARASAGANSGKIYAWGYNAESEIGDGSSTQRNAPVLVTMPTGVTTFTGFVAGERHNLAQGDDGKLYAWGRNSYGDLGDGTTTTRRVPTLVGPFLCRALAAGADHSLASVKNAPIADVLSLYVLQNTSKNFTLTASDADGQNLTYNVPTTTVAGGTIAINGASPNYTYTPPNANFIGNDSFSFTVTDSEGLVSAPVTVSITVTEAALAIVTTTADVDAADGKTSLREAIESANATPGNDTIIFNIPTSEIDAATNTYIIKPTVANGPLPALSDGAGTLLHAQSQPGFNSTSGVPVVVLDGSLLTSGTRRGLLLQTANNEVSGFGVQNFADGGIIVAGASSTNNNLRSNTFKNNGGIGIDLGADGKTPNDTNDSDSGSNGLQNWPVLTTAIAQGTDSIVGGTLNSTPSTTFAIDLYRSNFATGANASGNGEGAVQVGSQVVTTDANGNVTFSFTLAGSFSGQTFSALATRIVGAQSLETSEFGNAINPASVSSFTPTSGGAGVRVVITGAGFTGATQVKFGASNAASFTVDSDTQITAVVGTGASGKISVATASQGTTISTDDFAFINASGPSNLTFDPLIARPGDTIDIAGDNLSSVTAVAFTGFGVPANATFHVEGPGLLSVTVPEAAKGGTITVSSPNGSAETAQAFHVLPRIDSFTPTSGAVGTAVTITGAAFNGATTARFSTANNGFIDATNFVAVSNTQITCKVPNGAIDGPIRVVNAYGNSTSAGRFAVLDSNGPVITSFAPISGPSGSRVKIFGRNFTGTAKVEFGTTSAIFNVISDTHINVTVPQLPLDTFYTLYVTKGSKADTSGLETPQFKVTKAPLLLTYSPSQGVVGKAIVVSGANFSTVTKVEFATTSGFGDGIWVPATFTGNSDTSMTIIVPDGAKTGKFRVTNSFGTSLCLSEFVVKPQITSFSPTSGSPLKVGPPAVPATVVTITGNSFKSFVKKVKFGVVGSGLGVSAGTKYLSQAAFDAATDGFYVVNNTTIIARVPVGATTGKVRVSYQAGTDITTAPTQAADSATDFIIAASKPSTKTASAKQS